MKFEGAFEEVVLKQSFAGIGYAQCCVIDESTAAPRERTLECMPAAKEKK